MVTVDLEPEHEPTWHYACTPSDHPLNVDWDKESVEWVHHLQVAIAELVPVAGQSTTRREPTPAIPVPHLLFTLQSLSLLSRLVIVPVPGGIAAVIEGEGERIPDQVEPWLNAMRAASARVGVAHSDFDWRATVAGRFTWTDPTYFQVLDSPSTVGPLRLHSGGNFIWEPVPTYPVTALRPDGLRSWPVIVEGVKRSYDWEAAALSASRDLHRICALLSVAWGGCWVPRDGPVSQEQEQAAETEGAPTDKRSGLQTTQTTDWWPREPTPLPAWVDGAWTKLDSDPALADALTVHYEGLRLSGGHPSFALLAFVACIEGLGAKLYNLTRCADCHSQRGAAERFRRALRLVRPDEEALALGKAYRPRSETAHAGRLHGSETMFGALTLPGFLTRDPASEFTWGVALRMGQASRDLLILACVQVLPELRSEDG